MPPRTIEIRQDLHQDARAAASRLRSEMTRRGTLIVNVVRLPAPARLAWQKQSDALPGHLCEHPHRQAVALDDGPAIEGVFLGPLRLGSCPTRRITRGRGDLSRATLSFATLLRLVPVHLDTFFFPLFPPEKSLVADLIQRLRGAACLAFSSFKRADTPATRACPPDPSW